MDVRRLNNTIDNYAPQLPQKSRGQFAELCFEQSLENGSLLEKPNQIDQSEYVLLKGIARTFLLNTEGEEITLSLFEDNTILPLMLPERKMESPFCIAKR